MKKHIFINFITWQAYGLERVATIQHEPTLLFTQELYDPTIVEIVANTNLAPPAIPHPHFYLYDHIGNVRAVYTIAYRCATPAAVSYTLQYGADYYPFRWVVNASCFCHFPLL